ncbi:MAG TPA: MetQ/NlpA family ABC transporter substrate-binding protein [Myxococcota bacterium]|nr:MetQ/NlpA family ABC transporter substrate-binding protein [Myxococcota bacterium]
MKLKAIVITLSAALIFSGCQGCNKKDKTAKNIVKIGVIAGPENELMETVKKVAQEKYGLNLNIVVFNDYMTPNIALNDRSIDANSFQHEPFLEKMVHDRGLKLVSAGHTFVFPLAAYSRKIRHKDELKPNSKVAIPNDPSNEGRALLLLERQGLIELKDAKNLLSEIKDITKNPLNLTFITLEAAQLPRALDDVDLAIINTTFAGHAGLAPTKNGLFMEGKDSQYVNIVAVREEDKDAPWVEKLMMSIQNNDVAKAAETIFQGSAIPGW